MKNLFLIERKFSARKTTLFHLYKVNFKNLFKVLEFFTDKFNIVSPIPLIGGFNVRGLSQANPQVDWVFDNNGELMVDFVGKVESLEEDLKKCLEIIGVKYEGVPHVNKTKHHSYRSYYNNRTRRIVGDLYKEDIIAFDYRF